MAASDEFFKSFRPFGIILQKIHKIFCPEVLTFFIFRKSIQNGLKRKKTQLTDFNSLENVVTSYHTEFHQILHMNE